jgi:ribonucleoside-diphosphate reductase alpha chain
MANLCQEIIHPTVPIQDINDPNGEIGICVLSAVNWLEIKDEKDLENTCGIIVRMLDEIIDLQDYFCPAAENFTKNRRSLGIGVNNLAGYLAKHGKKYTDPTTPAFVEEMMEKQQYFLIKASVELAKEKGVCPKFSETKYSQGILPIDTYKKDVDAVSKHKLAMDWQGLRKEILQYGMRNSTLSAVMPCESSSVISNSTNGIEPPRAFLSFKKSKAGTIPVLVPGFDKYEKHYTLAFDIKDNKPLLNISGVISKYLDMAISTNLYYDYNNYENGKLPDAEVIRDIMYAYKMGVPTLYYSNSNEDVDLDAMDNCVGGACSV